MITLSQLFVYPVKSFSGLASKTAQVGESGLIGDRQWMLTFPSGEFITARQFPQLVRFRVQPMPDGIVVTAPDHRQCRIRYADFSNNPEVTQVWHSQFTAYIASIAINRWFSHYLQQDVQLRWIGNMSSRRLKRYPEMSLSFADAYPFLLVNQASLDYLQQYCPISLSVSRFRPNIVVQGAAAFEEDSWKTIQIGDLIFDLVKPCTRCILTTVDPLSGEKNNQLEPLTTLQLFRQNHNNEIHFGQQMIARQSGQLHVGDTVTVLKTQSAPIYPVQQRKMNQRIEQPKSVEIYYGEQAFIGNNQQVLLEQLEKQGISVPYYCRSGTCGACEITLEKGEVTHLNGKNYSANSAIRCCSCIPKTDIQLTPAESSPDEAT